MDLILNDDQKILILKPNHLTQNYTNTYVLLNDTKKLKTDIFSEQKVITILQQILISLMKVVVEEK